jgi:hypothetical protein
MQQQLTVSIPLPSFSSVVNWPTTPTNDTNHISCTDETICYLIGCCKGVPGIMASEHSLLCVNFYSQSPQRIKMVAQYCASKMPSGAEIIAQQYKTEACEIMNMEHLMTNEMFEIEWNSFVSDQMRKADAMEDF